MPSETQICNLALAHIGNANRIEDLREEGSSLSETFVLLYDDIRDAMLRDFDWPFARRFQALALVEEGPTEEWAYSYRYPAACVNFRRILSGTRNEHRGLRVPFIIASDDTGKLIYTDKETPTAKFTRREDNPERYPPDFVLALSWRLAANASPTLAGEAGLKWRADAVKMAAVSLDIARANALNEEQAEEDPASEFERARD